MKFNYRIESFPAPADRHYLAALTEGRLFVQIEERTFLEAEDVLLVEFAIVLQEWLNQMNEEGVADLYYTSMNFEEEPIFSLTYDNETGCFRPAAVWAVGQPTDVSVEEATTAAQSYIAHLRTELLENYGIDLSTVIAWTIAWSTDQRF